MIIAYFNEHGFRVEGIAGEARQVYDAPAGVDTDAMALYCFRWMVFNDLMQSMYELGLHASNEELTLYTDSRLVEELNGDITTDHEFAKASRSFYIIHDLPAFRRVRIEKCAASAIRRKLNESFTNSQ